MECLRDYIGVKGCGATVPIGNKYINSLPGISLENIENLADDEQINFIGVWEDVQNRGLSKFSVEINERFAKHYRLKQIRSTTNLLKRIKASETFAATSLKRGFTVELTTKNSVFRASNLQLIYVESLSFYVVDKTIVVPSAIIKVINLENDEVLDTHTIANAKINNGWNNVLVNKYYDANRIAIVYEASNITGVYQPINTLAVNGFANSISVVYGGYNEPFIRGVEFVTSDLPTFGNNTFGLTGVFSIACKFDNIVCSNKDAFAYPLWYLLGAELMLERLASSRINEWTTIGKEDAANLYKDFYAEFDRSLNQITESISMDDNDLCLICNERLKYAESRM